MSPANLTVESLRVQGLSGRVLSATETEAPWSSILLLYGQHASVERIANFAAALSRFGEVTCPDLAGFGGMDPVAATDRRTAIDGVADVLAETVRMIYGEREFSIVAMSFGLAVAIRMLHRHEDLRPRVRLIVSVAGVTTGQDLRFMPGVRCALRATARIGATRMASAGVNRWILKPAIVGFLCRRLARPRLDDLALAAEVRLWCSADWRTRLRTLAELLGPSQSSEVRLPTPVHHVAPSGDPYVEHQAVTATLRHLFADVAVTHVDSGAHVPPSAASPHACGEFLPDPVCNALRLVAAPRALAA